MRALLCPVLVLLLVLACPDRAAAQYQSDVFDPYSATGAGGALEFEVVPGDRYGLVDGIHRMKRDGVLLWERELPFTLREAHVLASGGVVGLGRTSQPRWAGELIVAVLGADGELRGESRVIQSNSRYKDGFANPIARDLLVDELADLAILRLLDGESHEESWLRVRISDAERLADATPRLQPDEAGEYSVRLRDVRLVDARGQVSATASTDSTRANELRTSPKSCVLVAHAERNDGRRSDALLVLFDGDGTVLSQRDVWSEPNLPARAKPTNWAQTWKPHFRLLSARADGRIAACWPDEDGDSAVLLAYEAVRDSANQWQLHLVERGTCNPKDRVDFHGRPFPGQPEPWPVEERPWRSDRSVELATPGAADHGLFNVVSWSPLPEGGFAAIQRRPDAGFDFLRLDENGAEVARAPYQVPDARRGIHNWYRGPDGSWIVVGGIGLGLGPIELWRARDGGGALEPFPGDALAPSDLIYTLCALADGGFVVRLGNHRSFGRDRRLMRVGPDGALLWQIPSRAPGLDERSYDSDLALLPDGSIAVHYTGRSHIAAFSLDGAHLWTRALVDEEGAAPIDGRSLSVEPDGTMVLLSQGVGSPRAQEETPLELWRFDSAGNFKAKVSPRRTDGATLLPFLGRLEFSPDGTAWFYDGYRLGRLDDDGTIALLPGESKHPAKLETVGALSILDDGRIAAVDDKNGTLVLWNVDGTWISTHGGPAQSVHRSTTIASDGLGNVWLEREHMYEPNRGFSAAGLPLHSGFAAYAQMSGDVSVRRHRFGWDWSTNIEGGAPRVQERRPDGRWYRDVESLAIRTDGGVIALDASGRNFGWPLRELHFFARGGDWERTIAIPDRALESGLTVRGSRILLHSRYSAALVDLERGVLEDIVHPRPEPRTLYGYGLSPDGSELIRVDARARRVEWMRL